MAGRRASTPRRPSTNTAAADARGRRSEALQLARNSRRLQRATEIQQNESTRRTASKRSTERGSCGRSFGRGLGRFPAQPCRSTRRLSGLAGPALPEPPAREWLRTRATRSNWALMHFAPFRSAHVHQHPCRCPAALSRDRRNSSAPQAMWVRKGSGSSLRFPICPVRWRRLSYFWKT